MKELPLEEKEKAYDELIERLKDLKFAYRFSPLSDTIEEKFPELKESKDERIRKALVSILKSDFEKDTTIYDISVRDIIAWLEKQGEQKLTWSEEDNTFFKAIIRDIENIQYISENAKKDRISWLKSLKNRYT